MPKDSGFSVEIGAHTGHKYINLTTFRVSGTPIVTPVWFTTDNNKIYAFTAPSAGKTKRLRNNPQVIIAPCTSDGRPMGKEFQAQGRILDRSEGEKIFDLLKIKYERDGVWSSFSKRGPNEMIFLEFIPNTP